MASLRSYVQAALTAVGVLLAGFGASLAASIETPPGGGDIPTGFALIFSWGLTAVGIATFALGAAILDDSGLGVYLSRRQRLAVRVGGGLLLFAAVAPILALLLLPVFYGVLGHGAPGDPNQLLSTLLMGWLAIAGLGGIGILGGIGWRALEGLVSLVQEHQPA